MNKMLMSTMTVVSLMIGGVVLYKYFSPAEELLDAGGGRVRTIGPNPNKRKMKPASKPIRVKLHNDDEIVDDDDLFAQGLGLVAQAAQRAAEAEFDRVFDEVYADREATLFKIN